MGPESGNSWAKCSGSGSLPGLPTSSPRGCSHLKEDLISSSNGFWQECLVLWLLNKVLRSFPPGIFRGLLVAWQQSSSKWVARERQNEPGSDGVGRSKIFHGITLRVERCSFRSCFHRWSLVHCGSWGLPWVGTPEGGPPWCYLKDHLSKPHLSLILAAQWQNVIFLGFVCCLFVCLWKQSGTSSVFTNAS